MNIETPYIPGTPNPYLEDYEIYQDYQDPVYTGFEEEALKLSNDGEVSALDTKYSSWCKDNEAGITLEEIESILNEIGELFGFQTDNVRNILDHLLTQLDSRSSRMPCPMALLSLHVDYIGGDSSNFKKWYFAAQVDNDNKLTNYRKQSKNYKNPRKSKVHQNLPYQLEDLQDSNSLLGLEYKWRMKMNMLTEREYIYQIGLYLLIWGEANNVRFMPECLCFLFQCSLDYLEYVRSPQDKELAEDDDENKEVKSSKEIGLAEGKNLECSDKVNELYFLDNIITPLYNYIHNQQYELVDAEWVENEKDHHKTIGYDDINQLFWFPEGLQQITLENGDKLYDLPKHHRYKNLSKVNWNKLFYKTYYERRTWIHLLTNFSRVWIIHLTMFWYYTSLNSPSLYTKNYIQMLDNKPPAQVQWSIIALGGTVSCVIAIFATISEWYFVPSKWPGSQRKFWRLVLLTILASINLGPSIYILGFLPLDANSKHGKIIGVFQFIISIFTFLYLSITPPSKLFSHVIGENRNFSRSKIFTGMFPRLEPRSQFYSFILWSCVFLAKFLESYFFLTLLLREPTRVLYAMDMSRCKGDKYLGNLVCQYQPKFTMTLLILVNFLLFFLDTYLWYIICTCIFSVGLSFSTGISVFTPWRNVFSRLPERISTKLVCKDETKGPSTIIVSQIWNSIIVSLYREHLLSIEQVNLLVYRQADIDQVTPPMFFVFQDDNTFNINDFFTAGKEAERRVSFFAQSLSIALPEPTPIIAMPTFTVLVPHYSEKIILSLKEIIKEGKSSKVSLLEYLKQLNPNDWDSFVKDTKILKANEDVKELTFEPTSKSTGKEDPLSFTNNQINDLPYYCFGFKDSSPEYTLRTRIWASLRSQTLYRTISGFLNYDTAIKLLYRIENQLPDITNYGPLDQIDMQLELFSSKKFHLLLGMQRYQKFNKQEKEDADVLFRTFPRTKICYLEEEDCHDGTISYYSTLLDCSKTDSIGDYTKLYRIKLSGNPILGDGKSDNQNHSLIFYRGEYIQVIDANQDNYLEECLKIKTVLAEFEEMKIETSSQYVPGVINQLEPPIAIIGAREYIFSENTGILGDIAAGKERTFGTLFSRTLAEIGGKLHYGHPDFLNAIFMTTRGGVSKAQKGLHLNEDIYAGMMATCRGGRIKHCDYYQCGKGRDMGFGSILNFTTKIGAGMGEQMLSREYFYLGTQLPIDRFLSFYYAHAGFHVNNVFIMLSIEIFMLFMMNLGSLRNETIICKYNHNVPYTDLEEPIGCYNLQPVLNWVSRFVLSSLICFFISFLPLIIQELMEKGLVKSLIRIFYHVISLSPLFEVFVCQIYARSLGDNLIFGGAQYIATGRGLAISRISFVSLYSKYADISIYSGSGIFLRIMFATLTIWKISLLWFWVTITSLCLAPFIFNPHQFEWGKYFLDYRDFIRWMSRGNNREHTLSWISFARFNRSRFTGMKKKIIDHNLIQKFHSPPSITKAIISNVIVPLLYSLLYLVAYLFINAQNGVRDAVIVNPLLRIMVIALLPFFANMAILCFSLILSVTFVPMFSCCFKSTPVFIAGFAHGCSVLLNIVNMEIFLCLEGWSFTRTLCGIIFINLLQECVVNIVLIFVSRELREDYSNRSWWSGKWFGNKLGWMNISQPLREFLVKILELNQFTKDFIIGHCILFAMTPFLFLPYVGKWHMSMIFWLKPSKSFRDPIYSKKISRKRKTRIIRYSILYLIMLTLAIGLILVPYFMRDYAPDIRKQVPGMIAELFQPNHQNNDDTGDNAPLNVLRSKPEEVVMPIVP